MLWELGHAILSDVTGLMIYFYERDRDRQTDRQTEHQQIKQLETNKQKLFIWPYRVRNALLLKQIISQTILPVYIIYFLFNFHSFVFYSASETLHDSIEIGHWPRL